MADVAKTVKVVSKNSNGEVPVCELTSASIETDSLEVNDSQSNMTDPSDLTLHLPSDEGTSLQELIESELALRKEYIESSFSSQLANFSETVEEFDADSVEVTHSNGSPVKSPTQSPKSYEEMNYDDLEINTQFILAERNHSFQTFTGNDMFFFNTLDDTQLNGSDPFAKEDQNVGDPFLEEEPNILDGDIDTQNENFNAAQTIREEVDEGLHDSSESDCITDSSVIREGIEQITLSTFDPFTTIVDSSKSEPIDNPDIIETPSSECADSDFMCALVDSSGGEVNDSEEKVELSQNFDEDVGACDNDNMPNEMQCNEDLIFQDIPREVVIVSVNNSMEKLECVNNGLTQTVDRVVTNLFDTLEIDDDDIPLTPEEANSKATETSNDYLLNIPEIDIIPPENDISESDLVSNEELSIASNGPSPDSELELANILADHCFEAWTTTVEVADIEHDGTPICIPESTYSFNDLPKAERCHQSLVLAVHDTDDPAPTPEPVVCSPEALNTSFSDSEKSELMTTKPTEKKTKKKKSDGGESTKTKKTKKTKKSDSEKENISVITNGTDAGLTRVCSDVNNKDISPTNTTVVDDELSSVSVKVLKSTYANQIQNQSPKEMVKEIDEDILHCGSIQSLKQTYCSEARKSFKKQDSPEKKEIISTGISIRELRRSFGDLSTLCDKEDGDDMRGQNIAPISMDMRASYCNIANLSAETASKSNDEQKSSFSKFDQLSKKTVLHVRSVDASKVQKQFNQTAETTPEQTSNCKSCGKQVFQMEQVKAERAVWHKNCFRCTECNKQLTVDIYSSHEGQLYCKPHFRELFKPKAVMDEEIEPPSDKPDLGLEELTSLNVKSRYQVFEKTETPGGADVERSPSSVSVKRSPSILSKLARFQAKGMDIGVTDDSLNGIPYEETSSSSEDDEEEIEEGGEADRALIRSNRKQRERPVSFSKMEDIKCRWESGHAAWKEERREERKQEIQNIRSRLFLGKQGKMKEMYEQAVKDSENIAQKKEVGIRSEKAKSIKERFERGEVLPDEEGEQDDENSKKNMDEDMSVFEAGISKKSRSLFLELDATAAKTQQQQQPALMSPIKSPQPKTYRIPQESNSPEREIYRDPSVIRSEDKLEDEEVMKTNTAKKMLSIFRQLEENSTKEDVPDGPKPLKRFTPPPEYTQESESSEEETDSEEEEEDDEEEQDTDPNIVRASDKIEDEFLKQAQNAARAKILRAKFERWEEKENKANANAATNASHAVGNLNGSLELDASSEHTSIDTTKSLRARFESLKNEAQQPKEKTPRPKVNRFVEIQSTCAEFCSVCEKKVYPLEKVETGSKIFHKQCFRCQQCNCILRMESYTLNNGQLYCIPHFKQLFISKGNYDEGFGLDQHKRKWSSRNNNEDDLLNSLNSGMDQ